MCLKLSKLAPPHRQIGLPTTKEGLAPTITAVYEMIGAANLISVAHYPKIGIGEIYETL